jgi:2-dehydropantoate 2-reductase
MRPRSYAIIGTGALGGFYGARLQQAGCDVHFLLHTDYEHVREHGLICESKDGDFTLPRVNAYRDTADMPRCDVVCVCLKTTQNHLLQKLLPPLAQGDAAVFVMQNGLGIEDDVAKIVGLERVMGGLCFLCSNKIGPGNIRHLDYGDVRIGEYSATGKPVGVTDRMRQIAADFNRAGIATELSPDLLLARWEKLVWNIPYNGLSVVLDSTTDYLMADPHTRALVQDLMSEVVTDAAACSRRIPPDFVKEMLDRTDRMKPYRTSMKIDYDEHHPMEVESIFGNPLRAVQQAGAQSPLIEMLYRQLKFLDAQNRKEL